MKPAPPCSAPACWWQTQASGLLLHWELQLGLLSVGFIILFFPPGYVALWDSKTPHRHANERVSWCLEIFSSFTTPSPGQVSVPNSFVSLFIFYILSYLLLKTMGCLSGCLVSSTSIQKLFYGICSCSNDLLMNLWGRKWSPHLIPLPS